MIGINPAEIGKREPRTYMDKSIWALDVELDLYEKYGPVGLYKETVDACLLSAKKMDELKKQCSGIPGIFNYFPELRQFIDGQRSTELKTTESNKKCINFMANYTPWPYPLNPKWFDIYIDALDRFKGDCRTTRFSSLYSREFCRRHVPDMPESLLRMLTGEDRVDRFGIFLKYKEAMRLGEQKTIILDAQIRILRALTTQMHKKPNCSVVLTHSLFKLMKMNCSFTVVTQEPWFVQCLNLEGISLEKGHKDVNLF